MLYAIRIAGLVILLAGATVFAATHTRAQDNCVDVEEDRAIAERNGFTWLGAFNPPDEVGLLDKGGLIFYSRQGLLYMSPVYNGCVSPQATTLGRIAVPATTPGAAPVPRLPPLRMTPA